MVRALKRAPHAVGDVTSRFFALFQKSMKNLESSGKNQVQTHVPDSGTHPQGELLFIWKLEVVSLFGNV